MLTTTPNQYLLHNRARVPHQPVVVHYLFACLLTYLLIRSLMCWCDCIV